MNNSIQFLGTHAVVVLAVASYVFLAAVNNLPEDKFAFYPWFRGTLRSLANHVQVKYQIPGEVSPKEIQP